MVITCRAALVTAWRGENLTAAPPALGPVETFTAGTAGPAAVLAARSATAASTALQLFVDSATTTPPPALSDAPEAALLLLVALGLGGGIVLYRRSRGRPVNA